MKTIFKKNELFLVTFSVWFIFNLNTSIRAEIEPGIPLPGFSLISIDDREIALQDYLGKIVIIHLWKCQ